MIDFIRIFQAHLDDCGDDDYRCIKDLDNKDMKFALMMINMPFKKYDSEARKRVLSALLGRNVSSSKLIYGDEYKAYIKTAYYNGRVKQEFIDWLNQQKEDSNGF